MKKILAALFSLLGAAAFAQKPYQTVPVPPADSLLRDVRTRNFPVMKEQVNVPVPGAPSLAKPIRIDGTRREIRTEEHGLIYPIAYDWNHDGRQDLLCGEFLTGRSRLLVYLNVGSLKKPKFTGDWFYATDVKGDTLYTDQWCCIGFHPQVVDVDGDGFDDLISGQYNPGKVSWWRGSKDGFLPRVYIDQEYYEDGKYYRATDCTSPLSNEYWNYTTARLADFNGDGLMDLFVGGTGGYRVALNIGTKSHPKFGRREFLYHVDGSMLYSYRKAEVAANMKNRFVPYEVCGDGKAMLNPVDWDGDGVLDILLTPSYTSSEQAPIYFFRGVKTQEGLRFEHARPLLVAEDGSKLFPGTCPQIQVCDWNADGVKDLLLGLAIPTINEFEVSDTCAWHWIHELGIEFPGKDAGENFRWFPTPDSLFARIANEDGYKRFMLGKLTDLKYLTLRHRGYPFIMYGTVSPLKAVALEDVAQPKEFDVCDAPDIPDAKRHVVYNIDNSKIITKGFNMGMLHVNFTLTDGYHLYTDNPCNKDFIPTTVELTLPDGISYYNDGMKWGHSTPVMHGMNEVYEGKEVQFYTNLKADFSKFTERTTVTAKLHVRYQACNSDMCIPPVDETKNIEIIVDPTEKSAW